MQTRKKSVKVHGIYMLIWDRRAHAISNLGFTCPALCDNSISILVAHQEIDFDGMLTGTLFPITISPENYCFLVYLGRKDLLKTPTMIYIFIYISILLLAHQSIIQVHVLKELGI